MRRTLAFLLAALLLSALCLPVLAADDSNVLFQNSTYTFTAHPIRPTSQAMTGEFAQVSGMQDEKLQQEINDYLAGFYQNNYEKMKALQTPTLIMTYKLAVVESDEYVSILMNCHFPTYYSDGHEEIMSLVVSKHEANWVKSLEDLLGNDAYNVAGEQVKREIRKNPAGYERNGAAFTSVDPTTAFYVSKNNKPAVIYGTNQLGDATLGTPSFEVVPYAPFLLPSDQAANGLLPLRTVCEHLGYTVGWEDGMFSVSLGNVFFKWPVGEQFKGIEAAEIHGGSTYISPAFFSEVLKLSCEETADGYRISR